MRPVFFVHVMRTGGMTFLHHLRQNFPDDEIYPQRALDVPDHDPLLHTEIAYVLALPAERRKRIRVYSGHFPYVTVELLGLDALTFTILRDPVDRTVSLLRRFQERQFAGRSLDEIYENDETNLQLIRNHQTKMFAMTVRDEPQSYRDVVEIDDDRLAVARATLTRVDVVGISERFDEFLADSTRRLGWPPQAMTRTNATTSPAEASPALRARIAADNPFDLAFYEFARDLVDERSE